MSPSSLKSTQVVEAYTETRSGPLVSRRLSISLTQVYRILDRAGVERPNTKNRLMFEGKRKLQGEVAAAAARDYAAGTPMSELRLIYGVGEGAIRTAARAHGYDQRPRGQQVRRFSDQDRQDAVQLYQAGFSQSAVAARLGAGLNQVRRLLMREGIEPRAKQARRESHGNWKGGRLAVKSGYIMCLIAKDDPMWSMANGAGYVFEHRLVMARAIGRPLRPSETVHHIDGDRGNNQLSNLQLRFGNHGKGVAMTCANCGSHEIHYAPLD